MMPYSGILDSELYGGAMYNEFFGLKENPFSISPDPQYFYMSKGHLSRCSVPNAPASPRAKAGMTVLFM